LIVREVDTMSVVTLYCIYCICITGGGGFTRIALY